MAKIMKKVAKAADAGAEIKKGPVEDKPAKAKAPKTPKAKAAPKAKPVSRGVKLSKEVASKTNRLADGSERTYYFAKAKAAAKGPKTSDTVLAAVGRAKAEDGKQPRGMVVEILKLASRANGVTPAELNDLTKWKGAPWKWLFQNPKKNGYCDRWGYAFTVLKGEDRAVRYKVEKL